VKHLVILPTHTADDAKAKHVSQYNQELYTSLIKIIIKIIRIIHYIIEMTKECEYVKVIQ